MGSVKVSHAVRDASCVMQTGALKLYQKCPKRHGGYDQLLRKVLFYPVPLIRSYMVKDDSHGAVASRVHS